MHTNKAPSLKPLQEAIQKKPSLAAENSFRETYEHSLGPILCV